MEGWWVSGRIGSPLGIPEKPMAGSGLVITCTFPLLLEGPLISLVQVLLQGKTLDFELHLLGP